MASKPHLTPPVNGPGSGPASAPESGPETSDRTRFPRLSESPANLALLRTAEALGDVAAAAWGWLGEHGGECECDFCAYHGEDVERVCRDVYAAMMAVNTAIMCVQDHLHLTPAKLRQRIEQIAASEEVSPDATVGRAPPCPAHR